MIFGGRTTVSFTRQLKDYQYHIVWWVWTRLSSFYSISNNQFCQRCHRHLLRPITTTLGQYLCLPSFETIISARAAMARRPLRNAQSGTGKKRPGKEVTKRENFSKSSLDFCDFIAGEARPSSDPHVEDEHAPKYVPYCVLRKYWESDSCEKIKEVFREQKLYFTIDTIRSRYLRTFSLLVYTGQIQHLAQFTAHNLSDAKLPLSDCPVEWPTKTPLFGSLWDSISREQWMFFPLAVDTHQLEDVHLDGRVVVPISRREGIISGNAASVEIVTIHDRCNFSTVRLSPDFPFFFSSSFSLIKVHARTHRLESHQIPIKAN